MIMLVQVSLVVLFGVVSARKFNDKEYYQLPQLFHLDDYQECFSQSDGLYCLGTFHVTSLGGPNTVYDLMRAYSSEPHTFNRTLVHRGYCVTTRCPDINGTSPALRFETCAARAMKDQFLQPHLTTLQYCLTEMEMQKNVPPDAAKLVYLVVICGLILLNVIGTMYDVMTKNQPKQIQMLNLWSMRINWRELASSHEKAANLPLAALHGIKVSISICVCLTHCAMLHFMMYTNNPRALENMASHPVSMIIQNSTAMEQMLFVISGFLLVYQLQQRSKELTISVMMDVIAKRVFRLLPVFLLVVGFEATWWPAMSSGPLWTATVGAESSTCRRKFWTHVLFVNNFVEADKLCVLSTWYMAVDVQLFIISTIILVVLTRLATPKLPALVFLFIGSCLLNAGLAYFFDWTPMLYLTVSPENIRNVFRGQPSFAGLFMSPWGNMPAYMLGLIMGYLYEGGRRDCHVKRFKWLLALVSNFSVPLLFSWSLLGFFLQHVKTKAFVVAYTALERSVFQVCCLLSYAAACIGGGFIIKFLAWRGWHAISRISYAVMLMHWPVAMYIVASTPQLLSTSLMDIGIHGFITAFYTYLLAIPITVLVEMPMKKVFDIIISRYYIS